MRRTLLVAEGTLDRPAMNIFTIALGFSITLLVGFGILHLNLPGWATFTAILALVIGVAWVKGRYGGPRSFRVEKPADGGPLRITGRFEDGEIPSGAPAELASTERNGQSLVFHTTTAGEQRSYRVTPPAFATDSMDTLHALITELPVHGPDALQTRYKGGSNGVKAYDAKQLLLLRFTQKPGYIPMTWLIAAITLLLWLGVLAAVMGS